MDNFSSYPHYQNPTTITASSINYILTNLKAHARTQKGLFVESAMNYQLYAGLADEFNQDFLLVNLSVGTKLFTKKLDELKLSVYDLLNQNNSIGRQVGESFVEDTRTQVLQRYLMLTFTYQFRNFKLNVQQ